jgi:hypothetical protein
MIGQSGGIGWHAQEHSDPHLLTARNEYMVFGNSSDHLGGTARRTMGGSDGYARMSEFRAGIANLATRDMGHPGAHGPSNGITSSKSVPTRTYWQSQ